MSLSVRLLRSAAVLTTLAATALVPTHLHAQQATERKGGPEKGTWGAETGVGFEESASLLKFVSPQWAVVAGGRFDVSSSYFSGGVEIPGARRASFLVGIRKYAGQGLGLRPIVGGGVAIGTLRGFGTTSGVYGEVGAAYFFNPHVSLGATGVVSISRDGDQNSATFRVPTLKASVYF